MSGKNVCCVCQQQFVPHPSLKKRQRTCGAKPCRKELKKRSDKVWREKNPDYFKGRYDMALKDWYENNTEYKQRYRREHPEYVRKNVSYVRAYRKRKASVSPR
jgi:hypothetical protein